MRTTSLLLGALASTLTAAAGCDTPPESEPIEQECTDPATPGCVIASEKQRIESPNVADADQSALVQGNTSFAFDLYQQLKGDEGNLFYSPHSISAALAMTWAGARGQTETDMAAALDFKLSQDKLHPAFNWLDHQLTSRGQNAKASDGQGFRLKIANAMWGQINSSFESPFLDTIAENYGAGMHVVDFEGATLQAIDLINAWADKNTEGKIPKLVSEDNITSDTRFVLTNAIYFNAAWAEPFEDKNTESGKFFKLDGNSVSVPMMHGYQETGYADGDGYQALVMPYDGRELSMVLVMPDEGTFADFESSLDAARLDEIDGAINEYGVSITMPKFKIEGDFSLKQKLSDLGMAVAFSPAADFSGLSSESLMLMDVVHKSFVAVNEAGTEAAAATAVIGGTTSAPEPAEISLDRPFLFLIRDNATGAILFVGRVADPS